MNETLLDDVKSYLKITWSDEDDDVRKIISRGIMYLSKLSGTNPDFDEDGLAKQLLLDLCRYIRNNSFEYFQENFKSDLLLFTLSEAISLKGIEGETSSG